MTLDTLKKISGRAQQRRGNQCQSHDKHRGDFRGDRRPGASRRRRGEREATSHRRRSHRAQPSDRCGNGQSRPPRSRRRPPRGSRRWSILSGGDSVTLDTLKKISDALNNDAGIGAKVTTNTAAISAETARPGASRRRRGEREATSHRRRSHRAQPSDRCGNGQSRRRGLSGGRRAAAGGGRSYRGRQRDARHAQKDLGRAQQRRGNRCQSHDKHGPDRHAAGARGVHRHRLGVVRGRRGPDALGRENGQGLSEILAGRWGRHAVGARRPPVRHDFGHHLYRVDSDPGGDGTRGRTCTPRCKNWRRGDRPRSRRQNVRGHVRRAEHRLNHHHIVAPPTPLPISGFSWTPTLPRRSTTRRSKAALDTLRTEAASEQSARSASDSALRGVLGIGTVAADLGTFAEGETTTLDDKSVKDALNTLRVELVAELGQRAGGDVALRNLVGVGASDTQHLGRVCGQRDVSRQQDGQGRARHPSRGAGHRSCAAGNRRRCPPHYPWCRGLGRGSGNWVCTRHHRARRLGDGAVCARRAAESGKRRPNKLFKYLGDWWESVWTAAPFNL